jgi:hypothetical protein
MSLLKVSVLRLIGFISLASSVANASSKYVGLIPSSTSRAKVEAVVSDVSGSDALFYNPAGLAWQGWSLRLFGLEFGSDTDSQERISDFQKQTENDESNMIAEAYRKLNAPKPVVIETTARVADLAIPYLSLTSFSRITGTSEYLGETRMVDGYEMNLDADFGAAAGASIKIGKLGIGYSQYRLVRSQIRSTPSTTQLNSVIDAAEAEQLAEDTVPFREFTQFSYGGAVGQNLGLLYRFFGGGNPSGIGISVLNMGGTKFTEDLPVTNQELIKYEERFKSQASMYGIDIELPDDIPEMINAGLSLGWSTKEEAVRLFCSIDENDIGGEHIQHKTAASCEAGLILPDKLALALAAEIIRKDQNTYHVGLLGARIFGGRRFDAYESQGVAMNLHLGYKKVISLVRIDLENFQTKALDERYKFMEMTGYRAVIGLTLIL